MTITDPNTLSAYRLAKELADTGDILRAKVLHRGEAVAVGFTLKDSRLGCAFILPMGEDGENGDGEIELYISGAPGSYIEYLEDYAPATIIAMATAMLAGEA